MAVDLPNSIQCLNNFCQKALDKINDRIATCMKLLEKAVKNGIIKKSDEDVRNQVFADLKSSASVLVRGELRIALDLAEALGAKWTTKIPPMPLKSTDDDFDSLSRLMNFIKLSKYIFDWPLLDRTIRRHVIDAAISRICPYCQEHLVRIIRNRYGDEIRYPDIDHWIARDLQPLLAFNFRNLVPACSVCNTVKGETKFEIDKDYHPYPSGQMTAHLHFRAKVSDFLNADSSAPITVYMEPKLGRYFSDHAKITAAKLFICERYSDHSQTIRKTYDQAMVYNILTYKVCSDPLIPGSNLSDANLLVRLSGIPMSAEDRNDSLLGNMRGDIFDQFTQ